MLEINLPGAQPLRLGPRSSWHYKEPMPRQAYRYNPGVAERRGPWQKPGDLSHRDTFGSVRNQVADLPVQLAGNLEKQTQARQITLRLGSATPCLAPADDALMLNEASPNPLQTERPRWPCGG